SLQDVREFSEVADAHTAVLRSRSVCNRGSLARSGRGDDPAACHGDAGLPGAPRRGDRHDHQPVHVFLAGGRGGGRHRSHAVGEALEWSVGLDRSVRRARAFYAVLIIAVAVAALLNVFRVNPIQALVWAGVVNGLVATPALIVLILLTTKEELMGSFKATRA